MIRRTLSSLALVLASGLVFAAGLIGSRLLSYSLGFGAPRMPAQAPESIAGYHLITGSLVLSAGLVGVSRGVEVLADSLVYGWALVRLLAPDRQADTR